MDEEELKATLENPQKILNLLRVLHQVLHLLDRKEMEEQIKIETEKQRARPIGAEVAGLGDQIGIVVKGSDGNVKQEISQ